jgi:plastocyanin
MKIKLLSTITLIILVPFFVSATVHEVTQTGLTFSPSSLNVNVGDVIKWVWSSGTHTTTSTAIPDGAAHWDSPLSSSNTTFEYEVAVAGQYSYKCTPHESMGMVGSFSATLVSSVSQNQLNNLHLYPNPAKSSINFQIDNESIATVAIYNVTGNRVYYENLIKTQLHNQFEIDVSNLSNGIYMLTIEFLNSKRKTQKFVIQK